ncbi:MAG: hypothetical protein IKR73_04385 [Oscillospiraceae bacterium]|nr:hypothetical protein [Oscillospiraceae bacterium]
MDEINMDGISLEGLDLPKLPDLPDLNAPAAEIAAELDDMSAEVGKTYSDAADTASAAKETVSTAAAEVTETAEEAHDTVADMVSEAEDYDLESLDVSSLISDMDGNAVEGATADVHNFNPDKLYVSKENRFHSMQAEQERKAAEEAQRREQEMMERAIAREKAGVAPEHRQHTSADYANENVGSYRYNANGTNKSLDSLYEQQFVVNDEVAEKGRKKAELISTIGMIYYGILTLVRLITFISIPHIITFVAVAYNALLVFCLYRFRCGSRKAREILGWMCSISLIRGLWGIGQVILGGGMLAGLLGAGAGFMAVLEALFSIGVSGFLAFMFFADDDISEYTKLSKEGGVDLSSDFFTFFRR